MPFNIKAGGAWKPASGAKVKVGGAWKTVESISVKVGGAWKVAYTNTITPVITATASPNPSYFSQDVTISGTVLPVPTGGTVLIRDLGSSPIGTEANVNTTTGAYSITIPDQGVGSYTFTANYSGYDIYQPVSAEVSISVGVVPTTTSISKSAPSYVYNTTPITFSGTVSPNPGGGTLQLLSSSGARLSLTSINPANGNWSTSVLPSDVGTYSGITAKFGGFGDYETSTSSSVSYSVTQAITYLVPSVSNSSPQVGTTTTLSGTLTTGSPGVALSGRIVTFQGYNGSTFINLGTGTTNSSGVAQYVWTAVEGYTAIRAVYSGETNYQAVSSSGISITVLTTVSTTTSIARSAASYVYNGTRITISGTVSPVPSGGTVKITGSNGTTFSDFATNVAVDTSTGAYSALMPIQNAGSYTNITATYSGSGVYLSSTSGTTTYLVSQATTAITNTGGFDVTDGATVTLSTNLKTGGVNFSGQAITFQARRSSDGAWINAGSDTTDSSGNATLSWTTNSAYNQTRAVYSGTTNYAGDTSTGVAFTTRTRKTTTIDAAAGTSNWYWRGSSASAQQVGMNFTAPAAVSGANQYAVYRVDIAVSGINGNSGQVVACLWNSGSGGALLTSGSTVNLPSRADGSTTRTAFSGSTFPAVAYTPGTVYKIGFWRRGNSTSYSTQWRQNTGTGRTTYWDNSEASPGGFDQNTTYSGDSLDVIIYFEYYEPNN